MSIKKHCFIVGSPRSGTTLLNRSLVAHPMVYGGPETHTLLSLNSLVKQFDALVKMDHSQAGLHRWIDRPELIERLRIFFESLTMANHNTKASVFVEKTPGHAMFIPLIKEMYPDSLIIHMVRNPIAVCDSLIRASKGWGRDWAPKSLKHATKMWRNAVRRACTDGRKCTGYLEVYYQELINDQRAVLTSILKELDLSNDDQTLNGIIDSVTKYDDLPEGFVYSKQLSKFNFVQKQYIKYRCRRIIQEFNLKIPNL